MTAPIDTRPATEPADRPRAPIASAVVVLATFLAGAGALAASSVMSSDAGRLVIAAVLVVVGWLVTRPARDRASSLTRAIGSRVLRGTGTALVVLGAYLGGLAMLTASIPDDPLLIGESSGPSPAAVVLMVYGVPTLALLVLATTGIRAWTAGAGVALPMIAVLLMADGGAGTAVVSVTMLAVGVVLTVLVVRTRGGSALGDLASAAAAMATSFAFGAGTSPFGTLGATQLAGAPGAGPVGRLSAGALIAVLAGALLVAAVLVLVAVARRDLATGVLAGSIFAMPPVLLATWLPPGARWPTEAIVALAGVPVAVALVAMVAIRVPHVRDALLAILPEPPAGPTPATVDGGLGTEGTRPAGDHPATGDPAATDGPTQATAGDGPSRPAGDHPDTGDPAATDGPAQAAVRGGPGTDVTRPVGDRSDIGNPAAAGGPAQAGVGGDPGTEPTHPAGDHPDPATGEPPADIDHEPVRDRPRLSGALATAACAVVVAAAAVAFVVLAVPVIGWPVWVQGAIALVVLFAAAALGYWLPASPGVAASVVALLGLGLASPWGRLFAGSWAGASLADRIVSGALDFAAAVVLAWLLVRRHPHPGVYAAAAYTLAGSMAAFLGALLFDAGSLAAGNSPFDNELAPVAIVALPLVLLGIGAAILTARGHRATGQAVGAVVFAAAGFVPLKVLVGQFAGSGAEGYALQYALNPLTPSDWLQASLAFRDIGGAALVAVLVMVVLALAVAASLPLRPSAPLAGSVALLLLAAVQTWLLSVLSSGTSDDAELLGQVLGGLALVVAVIAAVTALGAARRG